MRKLLISSLSFLLISETISSIQLTDIENNNSILSDSDIKEIRTILDSIEEYMVTPSIVTTTNRFTLAVTYELGEVIEEDDIAMTLFRKSNLNSEVKSSFLFIYFREWPETLWVTKSFWPGTLSSEVVFKASDSAKEHYHEGAKSTILSYLTVIETELKEKSYKASTYLTFLIVGLVIIVLSIASCIVCCCYCCKCCRKNTYPIGQNSDEMLVIANENSLKGTT